VRIDSRVSILIQNDFKKLLESWINSNFRCIPIK